MRYHLACGDPLVDSRVQADPRDAFRGILGGSTVLRVALEAAVRAATRGASPVLLVGEAGVGKELLARAIHAAGRAPASPSPSPFIPVDGASLQPRLLEAELFGVESPALGTSGRSGAGLFEVAAGGTVFLDNVGEIAHDVQPKLLRAIEDRVVRRVGGHCEIPIGCRLIVASKLSLDDSGSAGRLRHDLLHRLNLTRVFVPSLRDRTEDIAVLARYFLEERADMAGLAPASLSEEALAVLEGHAWPGNVRELRTVMHDAALRCEGGTIHPGHLRISRRSVSEGAQKSEIGGMIPIPSGGRSLASVEAEAVRLTLHLRRWNQSAAARVLEISRPTLARKMELYGIRPDRSTRNGK